ncbi:MAG: KOW domain-containing RNA-binding protein [Clostridiales bacterium]|nr:KOW domain-containing RNA-binding protein [Clostridiales bacterium]
MNENLSIGTVVLSTQGRDKGMYFVVVSVGRDVVYLADGGMRKLAAPKKKNVKHVSDSGVVLEGIAAKLSEGKKVFDSEVKSALRQFNQVN